ncbi:RNase A-like domain-containing protein [Streptomyces sp. NPDC002104]
MRHISVLPRSGPSRRGRRVGKTDEELEQRLRDQQIVRPSGIRPEAVSAFGNLADAQRYAQAALYEPSNQRKIDNWLAGNPGPNSSRSLLLTTNDVVGRSWDRGDAAARDVTHVWVVLRPNPGSHPHTRRSSFSLPCPPTRPSTRSAHLEN